MINLMLGDCLERSLTIKDSSVDLILCDLPYGTTSISWDTVIPFDLLWDMYRRVLKPRGCVILFGSQPFTAALVMSNTKWFKYELIWNKNKCGSPGLAKYRPMKTHENILIFAPSTTTYNPQMEVGQPFQRTQTGNSRCNNHKYGFKSVPGKIGINHGTRYPKSILNISRDFSAQQQIHPTQKPVSLLEWLILTYSNKDDIVFDNCMGSGSAGVAAKKLERSFIGIEIDPEFYAIAEKRINNVLSFETNPMDLLIGDTILTNEGYSDVSDICIDKDDRKIYHTENGFSINENDVNISQVILNADELL